MRVNKMAFFVSSFLNTLTLKHRGFPVRNQKSYEHQDVKYTKTVSFERPRYIEVSMSPLWVCVMLSYAASGCHASCFLLKIHKIFSFSRISFHRAAFMSNYANNTLHVNWLWHRRQHPFPLENGWWINAPYACLEITAYKISIE